MFPNIHHNGVGHLASEAQSHAAEFEEDLIALETIDQMD